MAIVLPTVDSVKTLAVPLTETQRTITQTLLEILHQQPDSRILLWAILVILQAVGFPQKDLAAWFSCSTRNLRYINQQVRATPRGAGKTGRPRRAAATTPAPPTVVGYSAYAGLWLLLPVLLDSQLLTWVQVLRFSTPIAGLSPQAWVLTVLMLAWVGFSHWAHLRDLSDVGLALWTGRQRVLDADRGRKGLHAVPAAAGQDFYQGTVQAEWADLPEPRPWLSVDEHTVGHHGGPEMPQSRIPRRGRTGAAHQLFGTFVLQVRRFVGLLVTQADQRLAQVAAPQLAAARQHQAQAQPDHPGFRSILDRGSYKGLTHQALQALAAQGVQYVALARRTKNNVAYWDQLREQGQLDLQPYINHRDLRLPPEQRRTHFALATCTTPISIWQGSKVVDTVTNPTVLIIDLHKLRDPDPKAKYVAVFFGTLDLLPGLQAQVYPIRQEHELAYRDLINALGLDALPKGYRKEQPQRRLNDPAQTTVLETKGIFLLTWLRMLAYNLVTKFLAQLTEACHGLSVVTAARKFLRRSGVLLLQEGQLVVRLDPFPDQGLLSAYLAQLNQRRLAIPWLNGLILRIEMADKPAGQTIQPAQLRKLLSVPT